MILKVYERGDVVKDVFKRGQKRGEIVHSSQLDTYSYFYVYETYSMMNKNRMSISIVFIDKEDYTEVHACSSGGGSGLLFRFDWGSGKGFEDNIRRIYENSGLRFQEIKG